MMSQTRVRITGHEIGSDLAQLVRAGHPLPDVDYFCTSTAAKWLWPEQPDFTLEHLVLRMTGIGQWRKTIGKLTIDDFDAMPDDVLADRCGGDAYAHFKLYEVIEPLIEPAGLLPVWKLAMRVLPILAEMGGRGMALDWAGLLAKIEDLDPWVEHERQALQQQLGIENLSSGPQVSKALYSKPWRAKPLYKVSYGYSIDKLSLLWARREAEIEGRTELTTLLTRLLHWGAQHKLLTTYYAKWIDEYPEDHRVHCFYSLGGTQTGRLNSYQTNLQNIPEEVRGYIIPSPGYDLIVQADWAQLEWRIAADISQDPVMIQGVRKNTDIHSIMAAKVLGMPIPRTQAEYARFKVEHPNERASGKLTNFATIFGIEAESLSWKIFKDTEGKIYVPPAAAQQYISAFFDLYKGYKAYTDDLWTKLHNHEWLISKFGRKWQLENNIHGWRKACNYRVQSTASDIVLLVLWTLSETLKKYGWKSRLIGEVHDSIVLETTHEEVGPLCRLLRWVCEHPATQRFGFTLSVPLLVEIKAGVSWGSLELVDV